MRMMMRIVVAISASYLQYCGLISEGIGYNNVLRDAFELQARDRLETLKDRSNKDVDAEIEIESVVNNAAGASSDMRACPNTRQEMRDTSRDKTTVRAYNFV
jgi:hypothetical protein